MSAADEDLAHHYPEVGAGGFTRVDGTVEFYGRVSALCTGDSVVLDFGAGRGSFLEDPVDYRRNLHTLSLRAGKVIGVDVDEAVRANPSVAEAIVVGEDGEIPLASRSIDVVVSDFVFEHIPPIDVPTVAGELTRVLKPGGWLCARTPNARGLIAVASRCVPHKWHESALRRLQPSRQARDEFRAYYAMNTARAVDRAFPSDDFENFSYMYESEPAYAGRSRLLYGGMRALGSVVPQSLSSTMMIFLRKRP